MEQKTISTILAFMILLITMLLAMISGVMVFIAFIFVSGVLTTGPIEAVLMGSLIIACGVLKIRDIQRREVR